MANDSVARALAVAALNGGGSGPEAYIKSASVSGSTLTLTKQDDTSVTFTDTDTTYTAGSGISITDGVISNTQTPGTVVSGTNDGTNWQTITIDGTTKNIPSGGGSVEVDNKTIKTNSQGKLETQIGGWKEVTEHPAETLNQTSWTYSGSDFYYNADQTIVQKWHGGLHQLVGTSPSMTVTFVDSNSVEHTGTFITYQTLSENNFNNVSFNSDNTVYWEATIDGTYEQFYFKILGPEDGYTPRRLHIWWSGGDCVQINSIQLSVPAYVETTYHKIDANYMPNAKIDLRRATPGYTEENPIYWRTEDEYGTAGYFLEAGSEAPITGGLYYYNGEHGQIRYSLDYAKDRLTLEGYALTTVFDAGYNVDLLTDSPTYTTDPVSGRLIIDAACVKTNIIENIFNNNAYIPYEDGGQNQAVSFAFSYGGASGIVSGGSSIAKTTDENNINYVLQLNGGTLNVTRTLNTLTSAKTYRVDFDPDWSSYRDFIVKLYASTIHKPFSADFTPIDNDTITINADGKLQANGGGGGGPSTYIKSASVSGSTLTLTKQDNTTVTFTDTDTTNYNSLSNQPSINNVTLTGNKSFGDLGINVLEAGSGIILSNNTISTIIPNAPADDGNYVLKCSVVLGIASYSWETA